MKLTYLLLLALMIPNFCKASGYWLELKGNGEANKQVKVEVIYGNIDEQGIRHRHQGKELMLTGEFRFVLWTPSGQKLPLKLLQQADCWGFSFIPTENGIYRITGINDTHPVVDRSKIGGENVLPIDYLCAQYKVGSANNALAPQQSLDILSQSDQQGVKVKAFNHLAPAKEGVKLRVFNPENWEKELVLNDRGEAEFWPTMKGLYVVRQDWVDKKAGTYQNISYTSIRYRCNYCFFQQI